MSEMIEFSVALENEQMAERARELEQKRSGEAAKKSRADKKERVKRAGDRKGSSSSAQPSGEHGEQGTESNGRAALISSTDLNARRRKGEDKNPTKKPSRKDSPLFNAWGGSGSKTNSPHASSSGLDDLDEKLAREARDQPASPRDESATPVTANSFIGARRGDRSDRGERDGTSSNDRHRDSGSSRGDRSDGSKKTTSSNSRREFGITSPTATRENSKEVTLTRRDSNPVPRQSSHKSSSSSSSSSKHRDSTKRSERSERGGTDSEHNSNSTREGREKKKVAVSSAKEKEASKPSKPVESICKECDMTFLIEHMFQTQNGKYVCGDCKQYVSMFDAYGR